MGRYQYSVTKLKANKRQATTHRGAKFDGNDNVEKYRYSRHLRVKFVTKTII
jgi:hypothetical protein